MKDKEMDAVLEKMCEYVGVNYSDIEVTKDGWFLEHTWTEEQQGYFVDWLADHLSKNRLARKSILSYPNQKSKKALKQAACEFVFNYGWKCTQEETC